MVKKIILITILGSLSVAGFSSYAQMGGSRVGGGNSKLGGYTEVPEAGKVPSHLYNIILGHPTNESIIASVLAHEDMEAYLEYGITTDDYQIKTDTVTIPSGQPVEFIMGGLSKDTQYFYQLRYRQAEDDAFNTSQQYAFHTPRSPGNDFVFTVQADSHLDENTSGQVYTNTLKNALTVAPDFHLALGDTFMTDKYVKYANSEPHYLAQRYYLGSYLTHSAPLFFALGNHDAETGNNDRMEWSNVTRNKYFPNPTPDDFYSGNTEPLGKDDTVRNYYSFEWGNSQFIALDPFRYSNKRNRGKDGGNWYMTLGKDQYDWLTRTLSESDATFKFVYLHNLVGGAQSNRGGAEASLNYEWGGHDEGGNYVFDEKRPDWGKPIHDVLVENDVSIVFHGHDHMYIRQDRDGIVYQLVQQPGHPSGNTNSAKSYGYLSGDIIKGSGHLQVFVSDDQLKVDFIDGRPSNNGKLLHSYVIDAKTVTEPVAEN